MENQKRKIIIACAVSVVVTFVLSSILYVGLATRFLERTMLGDNGSEVLSEVKMYVDALYLEDYDEAELYRQAAKGMTNALDDYTTYYTPTEFDDFINSTRGSYVGVGLVLSQTADGQIVVMQAYENAPGATAGVQAGDVLVSVDGAVQTELDAAAAALRGDGSAAQGEGSQVQVVFLRDGAQYSVTITRGEIHLTTVSSRMENGNIGYFKITAFDEDTDAEFKAQYDALLAQGLQSLVLDLRDNGGGDYYTACRLAGLFLQEGDTVVYRMNKAGKRDYEYAQGHCIDLPVVILANGHSASASEVFIGALRGNDRLHTLVGTNTFGKGITQDVFALQSGGGMSITVDYYYTPEDKCIHGIGIAPDVLAESGYEEGYPVGAIARENDVQLNRALEIASTI